jgi:ribonuclease Z|tara:strand:- start:832 stop:1848 length:1017 start_codon:yes stop_codon:yes gene_type:complete
MGSFATFKLDNVVDDCLRALVIVLITVLLISAPSARAQGLLGVVPPRTLDPEAGLSVILLGTGIPLPNAVRATACTGIIAGDRLFLVDTGRNCVVSLAAAGLRNIDGIFYTHYHSDHFIGLGEILLNLGIAGVDESISVRGPEGAREVVAGLAATYRLDLGYRVGHHGDKFGDGVMQPTVTEHESGVVFDEGGLTVTMFNVCHPPIVPAVGYRFEHAGKTVVVSGDTQVCPDYAEGARGADLLVSEAVNSQLFVLARALAGRSNPRQAEMIAEGIEYHSDTLELATMAQQVGVKKLAITHLMPSIPPTDAAEARFIHGMSELYAGPIIVGRDGMYIAP